MKLEILKKEEVQKEVCKILNIDFNSQEGQELIAESLFKEFTWDELLETGLVNENEKTFANFSYRIDNEVMYDSRETLSTVSPQKDASKATTEEPVVVEVTEESPEINFSEESISELLVALKTRPQELDERLNQINVEEKLKSDNVSQLQDQYNKLLTQLSVEKAELAALKEEKLKVSEQRKDIHKSINDTQILLMKALEGFKI